jgi:hypothetical protein
MSEKSGEDVPWDDHQGLVSTLASYGANEGAMEHPVQPIKGDMPAARI